MPHAAVGPQQLNNVSIMILHNWLVLNWPLQLRQIEWQCTHEVNADRADVALCVGVIRKPEQEARLPYAGVADQKKFEEVVTAQTDKIQNWKSLRARWHWAPHNRHQSATLRI